MTGTVAPEHPWLLPAVLTAGSDGGGRRRLGRSTRDWVVDTILFLIGTSYALIAFVDILSPRPTMVEQRPDSGLAVAIDAVLTAVVCGALWVRRRWPVVLAVGVLPLGLFSTPSALAMLILLFTVVVHRRLAVSAPIAAAHAIVALVYSRLHPEPATDFLTQAVLSIAFAAATLAWGMFIRARRQLVLSWQERALRAESEQRLRVDRARHLERARIAREMHDVLAHRISLLSLHAGALEFRPDAPPDEIARAAGVIRTSAHQALEDLREVIGVLREEPAETDAGSDWSAEPVPRPGQRPQPTLDDLPALVDESREAGMRVSLRTVLEAATLPAGLGRGAYRVVQEGLTNARKHAPGTTVEVATVGRPGLGLTVEVRNRWPVGQRAAPSIPGTGTGLVGLAERVTLLGGRLEHGRTESGDFRLMAWLPWPT